MRDYIIKHDIIPDYHLLKGTHAILDALDAADLIHWTSTGRPRMKLYLEASAGTAVDDNWQDINRLNRNKEATGYPTQKPLALLERIIASSTNLNDVVLDPFCGCATTCIAAEKLQRQWIGIDISPKAGDLITHRLGKDLGIFSANVTITSQLPAATFWF